MYSVGDRFVLCLSEYSPISWAKDQRHMEEIFFFFSRVVFKSSKGVASPWYHRGPTWRGCLYIAMYSHPRIWPQNLLLTTDSTQPLELAHQTMEENSFMKEWKIFIDNFTKSISFFYIWPMFGGHPWCFQGYNFSSEVFSLVFKVITLDDVDPFEQLRPFFHIRGSSIYKLTKPVNKGRSQEIFGLHAFASLILDLK